MKRYTKKFFAILFLFSWAAPAQETTLIIRHSAGRSAYNFVEVLQTRGRWIPLDVGYIDFTKGGLYREVFVGGGVVLHSSRRTLVIHEGCLDQSSGPLSGGALYYIPWTLASYRPTPKTNLRIVYFPYLPLNKAARVQHVLEHVKLERDFGKNIAVGAGYAAYKYGDEPLQHKPFVGPTIKMGRAGSVELWLQRLPGNHAGFQVRYAKSFK